MADDEIKKCLENIRKEAVDVPKTERQAKQIQIPVELAKEFLTQANKRKDKVFAVPIDSVNKAIGFKSTKNRTSSVQKKMNDQHGDLLNEGDAWKIGTAGKGSLYKIAIVPEAELEPKKEEEEQEED